MVRLVWHEMWDFFTSSNNWDASERHASACCDYFSVTEEIMDIANITRLEGATESVSRFARLIDDRGGG